MIIVTLVATLATSMVWQQWRAVQVEVAERGRLQSAWILSGALDWAKLILREDAKSHRPTALTEPWAVPLAEARLSTFLAVDKDNTDDAPEAFLSGSITDAQSRYNLRNLLEPDNKVSEKQVTALRQLFQAISVAPELADRIATGIRDALAAPGTAGANPTPPLMPQTVAQLTWFGIDNESIQAMAPYVVLLPVTTPVNLNTASKEVLVAAIPGLDLATAQRLVQARQSKPFKDVPAAQAMLPAPYNASPLPAVSVLSNFFEVRGRLRLTDRILEESSLIERRGLDMVTIWRQRENSRESSG
jgi:general secretion pathway protein K